jgi:hypothetical protein
MNKSQLSVLLVAFLCGLVLVGAALAQTSTNYGLEWHVIGSGGGGMDSTNYAMNGTVSQVAAGYASSTSYELSEGYWYPVQYRLYLPLILREYS